ncbi:MAG: NAD-glutamate dehydrogenase [Nocardiaceae bacterium]|nr:NAD-glutamate dehydrogenase [Nocardiaceae bacterium]
MKTAVQEQTRSPRTWFESNNRGIRAFVDWDDSEDSRNRPPLSDVCALFLRFELRVDKVESFGGVDAFTFDDLQFDLPTLHRVAAAAAAGFSGKWQVDGFARLVTAAGIGWRETVLVRAMCRFLAQARWGYSESYVVDSLSRAPEFVRAIVALFLARLDPAGQGGFTDEADFVAELVEEATSLDDDRIRRSLQALVLAIVRTNWFQIAEDGQPKSYIAFKIDSSRLFHPGPVVPFREIFVHSDDVEGVHLRSGAVARGGLRWSDRPEDFRTEVLGLMKTQEVKNAPIVPMGAKGAFVVRRPGIAPVAAYETFIRALLDVTDNIVAGRVIHPDRVVCADADDPYLVVAADKGTARFSDVANGIAAEYGFWLGDAFASGGSAGYDHKAMGITARGAWVAVERHFAEAGMDLSQPFTVAGIGDMSGDVFGNGMLLSRNIRLIAAFDHRHIFLDPSPNTTVSFAERERLAALPASSWDDYNRTRISLGGGVFRRSAKSVAVSPAARAALGLDAETLTPDELIQAILRAPVDLLWNGGIGTYVRSDRESDLDAQDPLNDRVRVTAAELRAKVVGEGGNLGFTERARIDYALRGGRINADFIDNAAGVATSDLEVNLKIAIGEMTGRDHLLAELTDDVADRVLDSSRHSILAISLAAAQASYLLDRHIQLIGNLEVAGGIDPSVAGLPTGVELGRRRELGQGLTRPEIAILVAQSKNLVAHELLVSSVVDDEAFEQRLVDYFPPAIVNAVPAGIHNHPLRREIIATAIADELVNRVGPGTIYRLQERLGVSTAAVALAYETVRRVLDLDVVWGECLASAATEDARIDQLTEVRELVEHLTSWLLRAQNGARPAPDAFAARVERLMRATKVAGVGP